MKTFFSDPFVLFFGLVGLGLSGLALVLQWADAPNWAVAICWGLLAVHVLSLVLAVIFLRLVFGSLRSFFPESENQQSNDKKNHE